MRAMNRFMAQPYRADGCDIVASMVFALSNAAKVDIGLIGVFFVLFPLIVQGLLGYAGAQVAQEKRENDKYLEDHRIPGSEV